MSLEFSHIAHAYGSVQALEDITLGAATGEITCLLGSSGCGKSTLLGLAAGLHDVQHGAIYLNGALLADRNTNPAPENRPIGLVFQDGALFPHMNVEKNIAFALRRPNAGDIDVLLDQVGLTGLGARYPHELSGGQQQRASLARALAQQPAVMLMDEPFANVDIVLRRSLRRECRMLLRERGATSLIVTHDPEEALDIADKIAVMQGGRIIQTGTPHSLYEDPVSPAIGAIFSGAQIIEAERQDEGLITAFGTWPSSCLKSGAADERALELLVHADAIGLEEAEDADLFVRDLHPQGPVHRVLLSTDAGDEISVVTTQPVSEAKRYKAIPHQGSVKAFGKG